MDFHVLGAKGDVHIMTTHRGEADETPLQLISAAQLARYAALEHALRTLVESVSDVLGAESKTEKSQSKLSQPPESTT